MSNMRISLDTKRFAESTSDMFTMPSRITLLIGGARSGKSSLAVELATNFGTPVTFIATARALDGDMTSRINRHRAERPDWPTVESPVDLEEAIASAPQDHVLVIDCLTMWIANLLLDGISDEQIVEMNESTLRAAVSRKSPLIAITNEVGLGVVPVTESGRTYRDVLGRVNQSWATNARNPLFLVAGHVIPLSPVRKVEL